MPLESRLIKPERPKLAKIVDQHFSSPLRASLPLSSEFLPALPFHGEACFVQIVPNSQNGLVFHVFQRNLLLT